MGKGVTKSLVTLDPRVMGWNQLTEQNLMIPGESKMKRKVSFSGM